MRELWPERLRWRAPVLIGRDLNAFPENGNKRIMRRSKVSVSRRRFLKTTTMAVTFAGVPIELATVVRAHEAGGAGLALPFGTKGQALIPFSPSTFSPHLNTTFRAHLNNISAVDLELVEVSEDSPSPSSKRIAAKTKSFSLEFTASGISTFPSGNYLIEHAALGKFLLFVSPVSRPNKPARYQAVFNHLLPD